MSASLVVDLGNTTQMGFTGPTQAQLSPSGQVCGLSGVQTGLSVDMINANTFCNLVVQGMAVLTSGPAIVQVQVSDDNTTWGDPTSGLPAGALPTSFASGGNLIINSGSTGYIYTSGVSGTAVLSGFAVAAGFQRTARYVRGLINSGYYIGNLQVSFCSQLKTTGSGAGFSYAPSSGSVIV